MVMEESQKGGVDQMKMIFGLCDRNNDGLIYAQDFRKICQEHYEKPQQVDALLQVMDPLNTGTISFAMFCRGIEAFLEHDHGPFRRDSSSVSSISSAEATSAVDMNRTQDVKGGCEEYDGEGFPDTVFPAHTGTHLTNGYLSSSPQNFSPVEFVVNGCHSSDAAEHSPSTSNQTQPLYSTPLESRSTASRSRGSPSRRRSMGSPSLSRSRESVMWSRESPTLDSRHQHLQHRHQLTLPESPSQGSTPAEQEAEEEVSRLSDQLQELSSRLEELEVEQKDSEGFKARLKKENAQLRDRLEEYEELLRSTEQNNQIIRSESQKMLRASVSKVRRESETQVMELRGQLEISSRTISRLESSVVALREQVLALQEEKLMLETDLQDNETMKQSLQDELCQAKELLRIEQAKWEMERDDLALALSEREVQIRQLQQECEEMQREDQTKSITASDMEREINSLKRSLELSHRENEELQSKFLIAGKQLVAASSAPPSLEMEMESASKDEVVKALKESEEMNSRLNRYIDGLLTSIIEKHPELLEIS